MTPAAAAGSPSTIPPGSGEPTAAAAGPKPPMAPHDPPDDCWRCARAYWADRLSGVVGHG